MGPFFCLFEVSFEALFGLSSFVDGGVVVGYAVTCTIYAHTFWFVMLILFILLIPSSPMSLLGYDEAILASIARCHLPPTFLLLP